MTKPTWHRRKCSTLCLCLSWFLAALCLAPAVRAQDDPFGSSASDDPFGGDPFSGQVESGFGSGTAPANSSGNVGEFLTADPLAQRLLSQEYPDPVRRFVAVTTLYNLGEQAAAERLLTGFTNPLTDAEALEFVRSIGSHNVLELISREDFPDGNQDWFRQTMANAMSYATSQTLVQESLDQLLGDDASAYTKSRQQLQVAGMEAAREILARIQTLLETEGLDSAGLRRLLGVVRQGPRAWDVALRSCMVGETTLRDAALLCLAVRVQDVDNSAVLIAEWYRKNRSELMDALFPMWTPLFTREFGFSPDSLSILTPWIEKQIRTQQQYLRDLASYHNALPMWQKETWLWQPSVEAFTPVVPGRFEVPTLNQSLWAAALVQVQPDSPAAREIYLVSQLQRAKAANGLELPLPQAAIDLVGEYASASDLNLMLKRQLSAGNDIAAVALLESMTAIGDASLLTSGDGRPAILIEALRATDARVRFAAVMAVLNWKPDSAFAGSTYFNTALAEVLGSTVGAQVVVASSNQGDAGFLNGLLRTDGWESIIVPDSADVMRMIDQQPISLLVLTDALGEESYVSVLDRIRELPRGKTIPVALLVRSEHVETARTMFQRERRDRYVVVGDLNSRAQSVSQFLSEASKMADQLDLPKAVKQRMTYDALVLVDQWLTDKSVRRQLDFPKLGDVVGELALTPRLGDLAAMILGFHGNPGSQKLLVQLAGNSSQPPATRTAAARAFRNSVQRHGILLTIPEIKAQYDRQNQSATENIYSQGIMNSILDTLEARHKRIAFDQLPAVPSPN